MEIVFFDQSVENFLASLEKPAIAKTLRTLDLLEKFGNHLGMPHSKKIGEDLFELRIRGKEEVRIFYCFHKNSAYLLHGIIKKSNTIPRKAISLAKRKIKALA